MTRLAFDSDVGMVAIRVPTADPEDMRIAFLVLLQYVDVTVTRQAQADFAATQAEWVSCRVRDRGVGSTPRCWPTAQPSPSRCRAHPPGSAWSAALA